MHKMTIIVKPDTRINLQNVQTMTTGSWIKEYQDVILAEKPFPL